MASNITNDFKRKAGLSAGAPDNLTDPLANGAPQAAPEPAEPAQVESARPTLRQVAPGITETANPGVFQTESVQNPGRAMPRPASPMFEQQLENVTPRPGSNESLRSAFTNAMPQPQAGPSAPLPEGAPAGMSRADILGAPNTGPIQGLRDLATRQFTPIDDGVNRFKQATSEMGQAVKDSRMTNNFITNNPLTRGVAGLVGGVAKAAGKVLPALGAGYEGYQALQDAQAGDTLGAVDHGVNSAASAALYNPLTAPVAGAYLGGQAAGGLINSTLSQDTKDTIGGTINQGLRSLGIGGVDDSALLQNKAAATTTTVAKNSPEKFKAQYAGAAQRAADKLGVDPNMLLAQWGLETGWGKSVVPGTNNLGNIKDLTGGGVRATDNMTGSRDGYRKFATPEEFADHFTGLMGRKYPGVQGAGGDVGKFTAGLKGYAEDPAYASKIASAYARLGGKPGAAQPAATPAAAQPTLAQGAQAGPTQNPNDAVEIIRGTRSSFTDPNSAQGAKDRLSEMMDKVRDRTDGHIAPEAAANVLKTFTEGEGLRGQTAANLENARATRAMTAAEHQRQALQFGVTAQREQETQNRLNAADEQNRNQTASAAMQKAIEDRFTTTDPSSGKPSFDANKAGEMRRYMDTALGTLAQNGVAKSFADLNPGRKEQLMVASDLLSKVQADATNWPIGWKPDFLKTSNPLDLVGLTWTGPNGTGDAKTHNGDIIPRRFIKKEGADHFFGKPTTTYDRLFKDETKASK